MPAAALPGFLQRLKQTMAAEALADLPDHELVRRFLAAHDDAAFRALLGRHGPMVFRLCRRMLPRHQDAEDAFQASFLVLARQAHTIRRRASLASWLHGVAYRTALEAREAFARRRKHETRACKAARPVSSEDPTWTELRALLDEELGRLPERLRAPLVLCYLEGLTQDEAARQLGLSKSTCRRNLERGRGLLAGRLGRRGVTLSAALFAPLLAAGSTPASPPPGLVETTVETAARAAAVPARVATLTEGVIRAMFVTKTRGAAAVLLAALFLGSALSAAAVPDPAQGRGAEKGAGTPAAAGKPAPRKAQAADLRVQAILKDAQEDAEALTNPFNRAVALCQIARAHARAGRHKDAAAALQKAYDAESAEVNVQHQDNRLWILAECQAEIGDAKGALEVVKRAISDDNRTVALRHVAVAQARAGDIKGALATVESMRPVREGDPFRDEALRHIAVIQAQAGDAKGALKTAGRIRGKGADKAFALAAVVAARVKAGDKAGAEKLLAQIRTAVPAEDAPRDFGLVALAEALAALGKAEDAVLAARGIAEASSRDWALVRVAASQAARGDVAAARRTAREIEADHHKGEALKEVVAALIRARDLPGATKAAAEAPDFGRCYALLALAKARAGAGQKAEAAQALREALALADRLVDPPQTSGVRESALAHYAGARAAAGDPDGALKWAGEQQDLWLRALARIRVAEALAAQGRK